jgi:hypothetical protein
VDCDRHSVDDHAVAFPGCVGAVAVASLSCWRAVTGAFGWVTIGERPRHRDAVPGAWAFHRYRRSHVVAEH